MKARRILALALAALLTVGSLPMDTVRAAEPDLSEAAALELSTGDDVAADASLEDTSVADDEDTEQEISAGDEKPAEDEGAPAEGSTEETANPEVQTSEEQESEEQESEEQGFEEVVAGEEAASEETIEETPEVEEPVLLKEGTGLTLNGNGGQVNTDEYDDNYNYIYQDVFTLDEPTSYLSDYRPKRDGWWFAGWYDGPDTETANYLSKYNADSSYYDEDYYRNYLIKTPAAGSTIYAGWEAPAVLNFNGGTWYDYYDTSSNVETYTLKERTTYLSSYVPKREDWFFTGWYADQKCTIKLSSESNINDLAKEPAANTTIYAGWTQDTYTVTYDLGELATYSGSLSDGTVNKVEVKVPVGQTLLSSYVPSTYSYKYSDLHYTFNYWADSDGNKVNLSAYTVTGDVNFTAIYQKNKIILTYDANGGYMSRDMDHDSNDYITKTTKETAKDPSSYAQIYLSGYDLPRNDDPKKQFVDWTYDKEGKQPLTKYKQSYSDDPWDGKSNTYYIKTFTEDITLYAQWDDSNYVLTLNPNASDGYFMDHETAGEKKSLKEFGSAKDVEVSEYVTNPKREDKHYRFKGWYSDKACTKLIVAADKGSRETSIDYKLTGNVTWYAGWEKAYKVVTVDAGEGYFRYSANDEFGSVDNAKQAKFIVGDDKEIDGWVDTPKIDASGKTFEGWYVGATRIDSLGSYKFTADATVTARYTDCYTVTVNYNGGYHEEWENGKNIHKTDPIIIRVPKGKRIGDGNGYVSSPYYEGNGRTFGGWYLSTDTEHANQIDYYNYVPTSDIELVAFWANNYTVTFETGAGAFAYGSKKKSYKAVEGTFFLYNDGAAVPNDPDIDDDNRVFGGWYLNDEKVDRDTILNTKITGDITYTARYTDAYSVTFDPNGGSFASKTPNFEETKYKIKVAMGESIRGKVPTVRSSDTDHKVFSGWFRIEGSELAEVDPYNDVFTTSVVLTAQWVDCYKLTFHTNYDGAAFANGSATQVVKVVKGTAFRYGEDYGKDKNKRDVLFDSPEVVETADAYVLPGWYTNTSCTGDRYVFTSDNHYVETSGGNRNYYDNMYGFIPTGDMDFYARLTTQTVTVKFNINDKTARFDSYYKSYRTDKKYPSSLNSDATVWTVTVPKGIKYGDVGYPYYFEYETRKDKDYDWAYKNDACKTRIYSDDVIDSNITLYCKWTASGSGGSSGGGKTSRITFNSGEGYFWEGSKNDKTNEYSYTYGSTNWQSAPIPKIDDDTRAFMGWYYDAALTKPYPAEYQKIKYEWGRYYCYLRYPEKVDDLYAAYGNAYTVVFDANGGYFDEDYDRTKDPAVDMRETTILRTKAYPGQSIIISDYTKRVRRDGDKLFEGWYTTKDCKPESKADVYSLDNRAEQFRPTQSVTLYANWVDYEKPDTVEASVAGGQTTIDIGESIDLNSAVTPATVTANAHWFIDSYSTGKNNTDGEHPLKLDISGKATGRAEGTCRVYAEINGVRSANLVINVTNDVVSSGIGITDANGNSFTGPQYLFVNEGFVIKGVITPAETADNLASAVNWTTTDEAVAEVTSSGDGRDANVIAKGEGEAVITATLGKKAASVKVIVRNPVEITPTLFVLTASTGASREFTASVLEEATDIEIKAFETEECEKESSLVAITEKSKTTASGKKRILLAVAPTAEGLKITDSETITIRVSIKAGSKSYSAMSTLTLNPPPQVGAVTASVGKAYVSEEVTNETAVAKGARVLLNCETRGTDIYYTTNGSDPVIGSKSTELFEDAIVINGNTTIKAFAVRPGGSMNPGKVYTFMYKVEDWGDVEAYKGTYFESASEIPAGIWYVIGDKMYPEVGSGATTFCATYTGSKITFNDQIRVYSGTSRLYENKDYTISYANNVNAARIDAVKGTKSVAPTVTIKGKGNYTRSAAFRFTIDPAPITMTEPVNGGTEFVAPGTKLTAVKPVLKYNGKKLTAGKDFVMTYFNTYNGTNFIGEVETPSSVVLALNENYYIRIDGKEGSNFAVGTPGAILVRCVDKKTTVSASTLKLVDEKGKPLKVEYTGSKIDIKALLTPDKNGVAKAYVVSGKIRLPYDDNAETACYKVNEYEGYYDYTSAGVHKVSVFCADKQFEGKTYFGSAALSFEISGVPMKSVKIAGFSANAEYNMGAPMTMADLFNAKDKTVVAQNWKAVTLYTTTTEGSGKAKKTVYNVLEEEKDYTVTWENNTGIVGKCNLIITGAGKYSGQIKKTINVKAYNLNDVKKGTGSKIVVSAADAHYSKTGAKPAVTVTFGGKTLREGIDYTVAYKKNTKLCEDYNELKASARPTVIVKGKGNFTGSNATAYFNIHKANIATDVEFVMDDVVMDPNSKSMFKYFAMPKFIDNGKILSYNKNADIDQVAGRCFYAEDTLLSNGTQKYAGDLINSYDQIPNGTLAKAEITVTIYPAEKGSKVRTKESMYFVDDPSNSVTLIGYYRLLEAGKDISKMTAAIRKGVTYTYKGGDEVIPVKTEDILVSYKVKGQKDPVYLTSSDFEIVSVSNNRFLGTATVVIRGKGQYGGTKNLTFKIAAGTF